MSSQAIHTIVLPTRPQPDTLAAIFILRLFGTTKFPGIEKAEIAIVQTVDSGAGDSFEAQGSLLLDIGNGRFDHHNKFPKTTASRLVAEYLGVADIPALAKLLEYAQRDDFFGRGTISTDPLDRAFGLSALVAALNKQFPKDPNAVARAVEPLFSAHYHEEVQRTEALPQEFEEKKLRGEVIEFDVRQRGKKLRVAMVVSNNPSLAGYLRSQQGGKYDVVLQRSETGYTNILTRPAKHIDLRDLAATIRIKEAEKGRIDLPETPYFEFTKSGRHPKIKEWYYDRATNSLQNGGLNPQEVRPTRISWEEFRQVLTEGLGSSHLPTE